MKLRQRVGDFRVRELLQEGYLRESGEWRVYRVTKSKMTTLEAAAALARELGVPTAEVGLAGLKVRQGIAVQHMSVRHGRDCRLRDPRLRIEPVGFADEPLTSARSEGNGFELCVRRLDGKQITALRTCLVRVRRNGLINYFDEQRFGNLRHNQGWIAKRLILGEHEEALWTLLAGRSPHDGARARAEKGELRAAWGNWVACREVALRFGQHHSIFEHLARRPGDFGGAFRHVASRIRLIHLYAFQSHLWNRAVAAHAREATPIEERAVVAGWEGPMVFSNGPVPAGAGLGDTFRLPGPRLEDVSDPLQRRLLEEALAAEDLKPSQLSIEGVPGFQLKGEDRPLRVVPSHLRVRPAEFDRENPGSRMVRIRFELPRGSYATLVVRRLFATAVGETRERRKERPQRVGRPVRDSGPGGQDAGHRWKGESRSDSRERAGDRGRERSGSGQGGERGRRGPAGGGGGGRGGDRPGGARGSWGDRSGGARGDRDDRRGGARGSWGDRGGSPRGDRDDRRGGYRGDRDDRRVGARGGWGDRGGSPRGDRDDRRGGFRENRDDRRGGARGSWGDRSGGTRGDRGDRSGGSRGSWGDRSGGARGDRDDRRGGARGDRDDRRGGARGDRDDRRGGARGSWGDRSGGARGDRVDRRGGARGDRDDRRGGARGDRGDRQGGSRGGRRDYRGSTRGERGDRRGGGRSSGGGDRRPQGGDRSPARDGKRR